jgi:hypothetical protein
LGVLGDASTFKGCCIVESLLLKASRSAALLSRKERLQAKPGNDSGFEVGSVVHAKKSVLRQIV